MKRLKRAPLVMYKTFKCVLKTFAILAFITSCMVFYYASILYKQHALYISRKPTCQFPELTDMEDILKDLQHQNLSCGSNNSVLKFARLDDEHFLIKGVHDPDCTYKSFRRLNLELDGPQKYNFAFESEVHKLTYSKPITGDFIKTTCTKASTTFEDYFAFIPKLTFKRDVKFSGVKHNLNVIVVGISGISMNIFNNAMPKTKLLFEKRLKATLYKKFHVQARLSISNFLLLLTGRRWDCRAIENYEGCNFLWQYFTDKNYVTAFGEDCGQGAMLNDARFREQPTDYYLGTFLNAFEQHLGVKDCSLCLGRDSAHEVLLNYAESFVLSQSHWRNMFFGFFWINSLAKYNLSHVHYGDESIHRFFSNLINKKVHGHTAFVLVSDGGIASRSDFDTDQDRLPLLAVYAPPWFRWMYDFESRLVTNQERLVNVRDVYDTVRFFGAPKAYHYPLGLFVDIPMTRDCEDAHIEDDVCICLDKDYLEY